MRFAHQEEEYAYLMQSAQRDKRKTSASESVDASLMTICSENVILVFYLVKNRTSRASSTSRRI